MKLFSRSDNSLIARWWWSVDKLLLSTILIILAIGILLNFSSSPAMANRIGMLDNYGLLKKQLVFLPFSFILIIGISFLSAKQVRLLAALIFMGAFILTVMTLFGGDTTKGAKRWVNIGGFLSLQPSEFLKPTFAILSAWFLSQGALRQNKKGMLISFALLGSICLLLLLQPDMGMMVTVIIIFSGQFFMSGVGFLCILALISIIIILVFLLYFTVPHFQFRIDSHLNPDIGDNYQVGKALDAFRQGGFWGRGPGEGTIKSSIPDAHTDFIFAVAGEEFGFFLCIIIVFLFAFVIIRGFALANKENNLFSLIAVAGILFQFGFQAIVNMSSTLQLAPTKGMTLPFISYGGSSLISMGLAMGMVLALTKKKQIR